MLRTGQAARKLHPRGESESTVVAGAQGLDLGILTDLVGYALRRAQVLVFQDFARAVGDHRIRPAQFAALTLIDANPGLSQSSLGNALGIERPAVVLLIDELERRGLAKRRPSPADRRSRHLYLTVKGRALLARLRPLVAAHDAKMTARLNAGERHALRQFLQRIAAP